jgi:hypothetical protein
MADRADLLNQLLALTHEGPVFGEGLAFGPLNNARAGLITRQTGDIAEALSKRLLPCLQKALPDASAEHISRNLSEVVPKTAAFVPALAAGELTGARNTHNLTLAATAVGCMYIADQLTDRGDERMLRAIETPRQTPGVVSANPRNAILLQMRADIYELALADDASIVFECFDQKVLRNEARLHRLSGAYAKLDGTGQQTFLAHHAKELAVLMVEDAGFQSVTSVLHAAYRRQNPGLPSVAELHNDPSIKQIIQVCNAAARIADEYGDWWMDAGSDPRYGVFSINPFNQYHPIMLETFCRLAGIEDAQEIAAIQTACKKFHTSNAQRQVSGRYITERFFDQMRHYINQYRTTHANSHRFTTYMTLCMRVGEISFINMMGDITLAPES